MEERLFDQLWDVMQAMGRDLQAAASDHGLTPMQVMLLGRLQGQDAVPQTALARQLGCDTSNLTGLVDALQERDLVQRTTPPGDRRVRAVSFTPRGEAVQRQLDQRLRQEHPLLNRLDEAERSSLAALLRTLLGEGEGGNDGDGDGAQRS